MTFVEQLFGLSPDGGSGSFEVAIVVLVSMAFALRALGRRVSRRG